MFTYPHINPVALSLGLLKIHWYGLMYAIGFVGGWLLARYRAHRMNIGWNDEQLNDLIFYTAMGVIVGGRVGYMLFYNLQALIAHPLSLFKLWQGGMSFHGGLLGVIVAMWLLSRKLHKPLFAISDFIAPIVPIGLGAGRIGNFINGELWGRVTDAPWAMVFPNAGPLPRHPSQIYEFLLEGVALFIILWLYSSKPRPRMAVSGLFLILYGLFRIFLEHFREPDAPLGFIAFGWLTMGQLLSIPMVVLGIGLMVRAYQKHVVISDKV